MQDAVAQASRFVDAESWQSVLNSCRSIRGGRAGRAGHAQGGNTCYLAATLQCLYEISGWQDFLKARQCNCGLELCASCLLSGTYDGITASAKTVSLDFWRPMIAFVGLEKGAQEDPHELWNLFLSKWDDQSVTARYDLKIFLKIIGCQT